MPITFIGDLDKKTARFQTGMWSFDRSFINRAGDVGVPIRGIMEVSGNPGIGKSTLIYSISALLATHLQGNIVVADIEDHFDPDYVTVILERHGYSGTVKLADGEQDHDKLKDLLTTLTDDRYVVGIVDSIGGISPVSEVEGGLEDANMGRRAKLIAILARRIIHIKSKRKIPFLTFAANHVHQIIGSRGTVTSGGVVKDYLYTTRVRLTKQDEQEEGILIKGKVDKNSFGMKGHIFYVYNLYGYGIHPGMTAIYDCILSGRVEEGRVIKLGGKSFGYKKDFIKHMDDLEFFQPFMDALKGAKEIVLDTETESE